MRVRLVTKLAISADRAVALVRTPALLVHIASPLLRFVPVQPDTFPAEWQEQSYQVRVMVAGLAPIGLQWIVISYPDGPDRCFQMRDNGRGDLAHRWDHLITITPDGDTRCLYVDNVEIEAGLLTPFVWAFARVFYGHRQRRWRRLADQGGLGA